AAVLTPYLASALVAGRRMNPSPGMQLKPLLPPRRQTPPPPLRGMRSPDARRPQLPRQGRRAQCRGAGAVRGARRAPLGGMRRPLLELLMISSFRFDGIFPSGRAAPAASFGCNRQSPAVV